MFDVGSGLWSGDLICQFPPPIRDFAENSAILVCRSRWPPVPRNTSTSINRDWHSTLPPRLHQEHRPRPVRDLRDGHPAPDPRRDNSGPDLPRLQEYLEDVVGPINLAGASTTINGTDPSSLDVDAGQFDVGLSERDVIGGTGVTFTYWYETSPGVWVASLGPPRSTLATTTTSPRDSSRDGRHVQEGRAVRGGEQRGGTSTTSSTGKNSSARSWRPSRATTRCRCTSSNIMGCDRAASCPWRTRSGVFFGQAKSPGVHHNRCIHLRRDGKTLLHHDNTCPGRWAPTRLARLVPRQGAWMENLQEQERSGSEFSRW